MVNILDRFIYRNKLCAVRAIEMAVGEEASQPDKDLRIDQLKQKYFPTMNDVTRVQRYLLPELSNNGTPLSAAINEHFVSPVVLPPAKLAEQHMKGRSVVVFIEQRDLVTNKLLNRHTACIEPVGGSDFRFTSDEGQPILKLNENQIYDALIFVKKK